MKQIFSILIIGIFFIACSDDIDSNVISSGSVMSEKAIKDSENLDKQSYIELADFFLDTKNIDFSKDIFIIFGKNNCDYCDHLKDSIKKDEKLRTLIKDNFNPYYINISYDKIHNIDFKTREAKANTQNFSNIFGVNLTPTIVFLNKDGSVKYIFTGFTTKLYSMIEDVISKNNSMGNYVDIDKKIHSL
ncbi:thioredoxin fold domain-containing protein [Helicobacter sp. MIT 14-3879]|uniref:thioredoxin fold domain-containing protein n=1 Tax=Helicobacter sp. MIT 14-3879 TaxID=2040649 RepID=UPI000E1E5C63|nr:thioredoxin fold domain-containing protein [Helicobacter sp. MIT 14-3879]RDU64669.1 hypothetical protein CQA44_02855 [Helicobacter sp. MIT 14-3879]